MNKKTLIGLIFCYLAVNTMGNGILPLLPLFAGYHGAGEELSGLYVAFAYLCLAAGTMIAGKLSDRVYSRKKFLALMGLLLVPFTWLLGRVESLLQVTVITALQWLTGGFCLAITAAILGREAPADERGRVFGMMGVSIGLGSLIGGFSIGPMVDAWGYGTMFSVMSLFLLLIPVVALLTVKETVSTKKEFPDSHSKPLPPKNTRRFEATLLLLLSAQVLGMVANGVGNMARSISMDRLQFSSTAITATIAVGGIISIPLALILGWLSDKLGRKIILCVSYLSGSVCLVMLIFAAQLWHFFFSAALLSMVVVSMSVGPAYVADIVKKESVGTGIALIQSIQLLGSIAGFIYSGYAFSKLGMAGALITASAAGILATVLILFIRTRRQQSG